jgi:hypothetical protein
MSERGTRGGRRGGGVIQMLIGEMRMVEVVKRVVKREWET